MSNFTLYHTNACDTANFNRRGSRKVLVVTWAVLPQEEVLVEIDEIIRIQDIDKGMM